MPHNNLPVFLMKFLGSMICALVVTFKYKTQPATNDFLCQLCCIFKNISTQNVLQVL